jgi:RNA-directed DNA polymerase
MNSHQRAAMALAYAFLDGDWTTEGLIRRGQLIVGHSRPEFRKLVRRVLRAYKRPPWDRVREFAAWLVLNDVEDQNGRSAVPYFSPTRWLPYQPAMGDMPWHVPAIPTLGELSHFFGLSSGELEWFADVRSLERRVADERLRHYRYRWIRKKNGGLRLIESPKERLRGIQRHLLHAVLDRIPVHDSAHGFVRGRSALSFAASHTNADVVVRLDIANFFGSIGAGRVYGVFRTAGYPESVAHTLTGLTTNSMPSAVWREAPQRARDDFLLGKRLETSHLPQGSPTSPALANLCSHGLDRRLTGLAASFGVRYSRYADDLVISGSLRRPSVARVISLATDIAEEEGFMVKPAKTLVMGQGHRQRLVGMVVNAKPNLEREAYEILRATLHNASRHGLEAENRERRDHFGEHLAGRVSWAINLNSGRARKLRPLLNAATRGNDG